MDIHRQQNEAKPKPSNPPFLFGIPIARIFNCVGVAEYLTFTSSKVINGTSVSTKTSAPQDSIPSSVVPARMLFDEKHMLEASLLLCLNWDCNAASFSTLDRISNASW